MDGCCFSFVNESQWLDDHYFPFPFLLTRRSWSLRKRLSHLRCASRSTTAWEESLSRRWASPPRSAPTPAGPRTALYPTLPPSYVVFYVFLPLTGFIFLRISLTCPLCSLPPHKNTSRTPSSLIYYTQKRKPQPPTPKQPPTCTHILHPAHYL